MKILGSCIATVVSLALQTIPYCATADDTMFAKPIAIAVSKDQGTAFIANQNSSSITVIDTLNKSARKVYGHWNGLTDLICNPTSDRLFAISTPPSQILEIDPFHSTEETQSVRIPGIPAKLAISSDGHFACVTMTWNHAIGFLELNEGRLVANSELKLLSLDFQPQELLALESGLFLVADAFGGQLAVVDPKSSKTIASHRILGHHIGGLARDELLRSVVITHQRLSSVAHSNRDDVHWGNLMQNLVSVIPETHLVDPNTNLNQFTERVRIGEVGNGSADPSGVVARDGQVVVAITGTNQIAVCESRAKRFRFQTLEQSPTRLVRLGETRILWISTLGNTAAIMEMMDDRFETLASFGVPRVLTSPEDRGEALFFSGRLAHDGWMSCSSCHVNGHSPDLLADTKGDGRHDTPKRIPSLFNVGLTGPWTWSGSEISLEGQIAKTLSTTMHRDVGSINTAEVDLSVANDLAAFLKSLRSPSVDSANPNKRTTGQLLFETRGCVRCHEPSFHFTSRGTYDVGIIDEAGENKFNPPSLIGLQHRKAFLHDARHKTLADLLLSHPDTNRKWTLEEVESLSIFLWSL